MNFEFEMDEEDEFGFYALQANLLANIDIRKLTEEFEMKRKFMMKEVQRSNGISRQPNIIFEHMEMTAIIDALDKIDVKLEMNEEMYEDNVQSRRIPICDSSDCFDYGHEESFKPNYKSGFSHCNRCKSIMNIGYFCKECYDFYLCTNCNGKERHPHVMEKLHASESRRNTINICINILMHTCQCKDSNCKLICCKQMKKLILHIKICKRNMRNICSVCKQIVALCYYHARYCQKVKCPMPFCLGIKLKLKHQQRHQRLQHTQLLRQNLVSMGQLRQTTVINTSTHKALHNTVPTVMSACITQHQYLRLEQQRVQHDGECVRPLYLTQAHRKQQTSINVVNAQKPQQRDLIGELASQLSHGPIPEHVVLQFMQSCRGQNSPEKMNQISNILKDNAYLVAALREIREKSL